MRLQNYINGEWRSSSAATEAEVVNPATAEVLSTVPFSEAKEVDEAVVAARAAFRDWSKKPVGQRIQYLFRLKALLEEHFEEISELVTRECGKTLPEARGELRRGIENVETACAAPIMTQGRTSPQIAAGIDETVLLEPLGVVAAITPFNFPAMIPLWFLPYAVACGNCILLKPSEKVPMAVRRIVELVEAAGMPAGVVQLLNGAQPTVEAILDHPDVRAISFVGSTPAARAVYTRASANGKRVQCQGGARNPILVMEDTDPSMTSDVIAESAFGCAGQRCLAGSLAVTVGSPDRFMETMLERAETRRVGYGLDAGIEMGPVITRESLERIENSVSTAIEGGARPLRDGRGLSVDGFESGNFMGPTVLEHEPSEALLGAEIFGPVLSVVHFDTLDRAIEFINRGPYGNMACIFTSSGGAGQRFRNTVDAGNIGINIGVAAPISTFPFSGRRESFFGDLHGQGHDAIHFYTDKKVVIERWPS